MNENLNRHTAGLNLESCQALKGLLALGILSTHIYGELTLSHSFEPSALLYIIGFILHNGAFLSVGVFFFLSGYGVTVQYSMQKERYIQNYWKKRIIPLVIINVVLILLYALLLTFIGNAPSFIQIIQSFLFGNTIVRNGWYIQAIILFYILLYFVFITAKTEKAHIFLMVIAVVCYCLICIWLGIGSIWYESVIGLPIGMLAFYHLGWVSFPSKKTAVFRILCSMILFFVLFSAYYLSYKLYDIFAITIICKIAVVSVFCILVARLIPYLPLYKSNILKHLGKISLEIYVLQGIPLTLLHSNVMYISNSFVFVLTVVGITVILAELMHPTFKKIKSVVLTR